MHMNWEDLAFIHWPVSVDELRPHIPEPLEIDTYDGSAYIAITPFYMTGVRPRFAPAIPGMSRFPEINVRTYVKYGGRHGIWFFSLDITNPIAVGGARTFFRLPYNLANMTYERNGEWIDYRTERTADDERAASFSARYKAVSPVYKSNPGDLDHFLTERYSFFTGSNERLWRCDITHEQWPLQHGELQLLDNTMFNPLKIHVPDIKPMVHFSRFLEVKAAPIFEVYSR